LALQEVHPEHEWLPWKLSHAPHGFWAEKPNRKSFFDWFANSQGFKENEFARWYGVSHADIVEAGGGGLLQGHYNGSLSAALADVYPSHIWLPWKFFKAPNQQVRFQTHVTRRSRTT
jgi:hypothetical protein